MMGPTTEHIYFKIEQFSGFARLIGEQRSSVPVVIQQLSWKIVAKHEIDRQTKTRYLGFNVQCNAQDSRITDWNCVADLILHVQPRRNNISPVQEKFYRQQFSAKNKYCGNSRMVTMDQLMYSENGWYNEAQDNIILQAIITADPAYFHFRFWPLQPVEIPQKKKKQTKTLANRMKDLLSTGKEADVQFLVGTEQGRKEFSAHKGILTTVSDVFERMFQFDAENGNGNRIVEVPDVTPQAFQVLLNYIYADELDGLNQDNTFDVLYTANKYNAIDLFNKCLDFVKLCSDNVFFIFAQARLYDIKDLIKLCWTFIDKNAYAVFATKEFLQIDQDFLIELFGRDQLSVSEIAIWDAALRWADAQCHKFNMEVTGDNRRKMLGPALFMIRFPIIPKEQFASIIVPTNVLTKDEMFSVCLYHANPTSGLPSHYPLGFSCKFRAC